MYKAYLNGRAEKDPSEFWYQGEIGFSISTSFRWPIKRCGVFGVSSNEYLNYAMKNRQEWEDEGEELVADEKYGTLNCECVRHNIYVELKGTNENE
jgi:hypothetical protein